MLVEIDLLHLSLPKAKSGIKDQKMKRKRIERGKSIFQSDCRNVNILENLFLQWICFSTALSSSSFMEVVKAIAKHGSAANGSVAVRADGKSYTYRQLFLCAERISTLLRSSDSQSVS